MTFVLVHGGGFAASCWAPILPYLPDDTITLDLPGRGGRPADLAHVTIADFVAAVVDEIETRDLRAVVLVGHSLAGITLPRVAARIPERIARLVYVSCSAPPGGVAVLDTLSELSPAVARVAAQLGAGVVTAAGTLAPEFAETMFCNDMDDARRAWTVSQMVPEAMGVLREPNDLAGSRLGIPQTYVRLLRDASLLVPTQDQMIANLGIAPSDVVDLDVGHMVMISAPVALAEVLLDVVS